MAGLWHSFKLVGILLIDPTDPMRIFSKFFATANFVAGLNATFVGLIPKIGT